jgi:hypothetical protein
LIEAELFGSFCSSKRTRRKYFILEATFIFNVIRDKLISKARLEIDGDTKTVVLV